MKVKPCSRVVDRLGRATALLLQRADHFVKLFHVEHSPGELIMEGPTRPRRLGRGLDALLGMSDTTTDTSATRPTPVDQAPGEAAFHGAGAPPVGVRVLDVPLDQITANPHQPRRAMDEARLGELAQSIAASGIIQPVLLRRVADTYQLIAGERRFRAAKRAGLSVIPAIVRQVDDLQQAQLALIENIQREDLNAIDRAESYRALLTKLGVTQEQLAQRLGEDRSTIANHVRLLELPEAVRKLLRDDKLSLGHAKILAGVDDPAEQERLANLVVSQGLSVRNLERILASDTPVPRQTRRPSAHLQDLEVNISRQLGLKVQVRSLGKRGRLVIHYGNLDQFDELMGRLGISITGE
jgi:ParB family transcriptional regulator, chromosome partitioning protein